MSHSSRVSQTPADAASLAQTVAKTVESPVPSSLFPEPLVAFEEYMHLDYNSTYPSAITSRLRFSGRLDVDRMRRALETAARRHPLFRCRVKKMGRRYYWIPDDAPLSFVSARRETIPGADGDDLFENARALRLDRGPGLSAIVIWDDVSADVVLRCHHATTDGVGLHAFLVDAFREYAALAGLIPQDFERRPLNFDAFRQRGKLGLTLWNYWRNYYHTCVTTIRFLWIPPYSFDLLPGAPKERSLDSDVDEIRRRDHFITAELTPEESKRCFAAAKSLGVTVNDLALSAFVWSLDKIRRERGEKTGGRIRVATPIDMRNKNHSESPACNVVTMAFVDFLSCERRALRRLLKITQKRMNIVKKHGQKYFLDLALRIGKRLAGLVGDDLSFFLRSNKCRATATFSNVGRLFHSVPLDKTEDGRLRVGDLILEKIENAPPIRYRSPISVGAATYGKRFCFGFRFDSRYLTPEEARMFLDSFAFTCANFLETLENDANDKT